MKNNKLYVFLAMLIATLTSTACFEDQGYDTLYGGNMVEFNAANLPNGITSSFVRLNASQTDDIAIQINRVSTIATGAITVNIEADPISTAVAGVHYSLASTSITIPSGEFVTNLPITILTGNIDPSEAPNLVLKITSASGAEVSAKYSTLRVAIRVICPSDLGATYTVFWEYIQTGDGSGGPRQTATNFVIASADRVVLTEVSAGLYQFDDMSFGLYPGLYADSKPAGRMRDNCTVLTGLSTNVDQYSDPFTMSGVDNADGTLKLTWSNTWGDGGTVILTKI